MKIAITGASGQLGRLIIEELRNKVPTEDLVALVRNPAKAADLGVEVREADYEQPDTLEAALIGIDTLMLISGSEVGRRIAQHRNIIDAAKKSGVKRIVYTSLLHADSSPLSLAPEHVETEALLKTSGLSITLLRNGWYTENYTGSVASALTNGALLGSAGQGKISSASRVDYAAAAAVVLTSDGHEGKTYELAGDSAYTLEELAAEISHQSGKDIPYKDLAPSEYTAILTAAGVPAPWPDALPAIDVEVAKGALFDDSNVLSKLIGRPTTSLKAAVADALKQA